MGIINRRNAILGWSVWQVTKAVAKWKAKAAASGPGSRAGLNKGAVASMIAAAGGVLWFWRKKSDDATQS
jgi:hypothetical protein